MTVSNTGPLVPPDEVDRLFQPFQRLGAQRTRQPGGHGLGLAIAGHAVRLVADRVAGLLAVVDEAAGTDHEIAALARPLDAQRAATAAQIVTGITKRAPLRSGLGRADAVDTIWLLMDPVVYRRLTRDCGWSPDHFEHWLTDSIRRLLLPTA